MSMSGRKKFIKGTHDDQHDKQLKSSKLKFNGLQISINFLAKKQMLRGLTTAKLFNLKLQKLYVITPIQDLSETKQTNCPKTRPLLQAKLMVVHQ